MSKFFALLFGLTLGFAAITANAAVYHYPQSSQSDQGAGG